MIKLFPNLNHKVRLKTLTQDRNGNLYVVATLEGSVSLTCNGLKTFQSLKDTNGKYLVNFIVAKFDDKWTCQWVQLATADQNVEIYRALLSPGSTPANDVLYFTGTVGKGATKLDFLAKTQSFSPALVGETAFVSSVSSAGGVGKAFFATFKNADTTRIYGLDIDGQGQMLAIAGEAIGELTINGKDKQGQPKTYKLTPFSSPKSQAFLTLYDTVNGHFVWADAYSLGNDGRFQYLDVAFTSDNSKLFVVGQEGQKAGKYKAGIRRYDVSSGIADAGNLIDPGGLERSRAVSLQLLDVPNTKFVQTIVAVETNLDNGLLGVQRQGRGESRTSLWFSEWEPFGSIPKTESVSSMYPYWRPSSVKLNSKNQPVVVGAYVQTVSQSAVSYGVFAATFTSAGKLTNSVQFFSIEQAVLEDFVLDSKDIITAVGHWQGDLQLQPTSIQSPGRVSSFLWKYYLEP